MTSLQEINLKIESDEVLKESNSSTLDFGLIFKNLDELLFSLSSSAATSDTLIRCIVIYGRSDQVLLSFPSSSSLDV
jgi:hypothetical protein